MFYHSMQIGFIEIPKANSSLNIYTVGCPFKCKGCHNPDLQDINHPQRKILSIDDINRYIINSKGFINGICWLGGEPLYQFDDFIKINSEIIYYNKNIIITVFTGYKLNEFNEEQYNKLLNCGIDYIFDGTWNGYPLGHEKSNQKAYKKINNKFEEIDYKNYKLKLC